MWRFCLFCLAAFLGLICFGNGTIQASKNFKQVFKGSQVYAWPNKYLPISRKRWEAIIRTLKTVDEPTYDNVLEATIALFLTGKRRLHQAKVMVPAVKSYDMKRFYNFLRDIPGEEHGASLYWSGEEDEPRLSNFLPGEDPATIEQFQGNWKYRFVWKKASSWIVRKLFGGLERDKMAVLMFGPDTDLSFLRLPTDGEVLTEAEWRKYLGQYDVDVEPLNQAVEIPW